MHSHMRHPHALLLVTELGPKQHAVSGVDTLRAVCQIQPVPMRIESPHTNGHLIYDKRAKSNNEERQQSLQ